MLATYTGDNQDPLPAYRGEPADLLVRGKTVQKIAEDVYQELGPKAGGPDFRVAVAGLLADVNNPNKFEVCLINRVERNNKNG